MPILVAVAIIVLVVVFILSQRTPSSRTEIGTQGVLPSPSGGSHAHGPYTLAFITDGKLFYQAPGEDIRELQSPHVQMVMERLERHRQQHGWKEGTAFGTSYTGRNRDAPTAGVGIRATSAQFVTRDCMLYVLRDESFGGLFEYNFAQDQEKRLLHKQYLALDDLRIHPNGKRLLCTQHARNGAANIVTMDANGDNLVELTSGDTVDAAPAWVPGQEQAILFQTSGLARNEAGFIVAQGPSAIQMADTAAGSLTTILEHPQWDFLQPRVGPDGYLYYIRRPYEAQQYGVGNAVTDALLFPFRLLRALFHYLNFFSLMYSRKPLTTASGPAVQADLKDILVRGKRLDAQAALQAHNRLSGVPSLVPESWQLFCRSPQGEEYRLASHVASYDIAYDGAVLFSNGYGVFALDGGKPPRVLLKDKLVLDVIVAPEHSSPSVKIW